MSDFFEIDFLDVEKKDSGDAITLRYELNGTTRIHVVDGGFQDTGEKVVEHINTYYGNPDYIDSVVVTHSDGDHAGGLRKVLEEFDVGELWMLRPWLYANELIDRFARFTKVENLIKRLKDIYPYIAALEELATEKDTPIPIREPFQGAAIGQFRVMTPTRTRYLDLVVESDKTPESVELEERSIPVTVGVYFQKAAARVMNMLKAAWGDETFSPEGTSAENEMSVIQYANLCGKRILLTADAGRSALTEAADYAPLMGLTLPGVHRFQVPHHGSRHNVSIEVLDRWLGPRLPELPGEGAKTFTAIISASKDDEDHPRKAVVRAMIHRGGKVVSTKTGSLNTALNAPVRNGWVPATPFPYPEEQEE